MIKNTLYRRKTTTKSNHIMPVTDGSLAKVDLAFWESDDPVDIASTSPPSLNPALQARLLSELEAFKRRIQTLGGRVDPHDEEVWLEFVTYVSNIPLPDASSLERFVWTMSPLKGVSPDVLRERLKLFGRELVRIGILDPVQKRSTGDERSLVDVCNRFIATYKGRPSEREKREKLSELLAWCESEGISSLDALAHRVLDFMRYLNEEKVCRNGPRAGLVGVSPQTYENYRRVLTRFFNWCIDEGLLSWNPANNILTFNSKKTPVRGVSIDVDDLRRFYQSLTDTFMDTRNGLLMAYYLDFGRPCEVPWVRISQIDIDKQRLQVKTKWHKLRTVYLSDRTTQLLKRYLVHRRGFIRTKADQLLRAGRHAEANAMLRRDVLFLSEVTGEPLSASGARQALRDAVQRAGLDKRKITPRNLRLTAVQLFIENGGSVLDLQDRMAHEDYRTTVRYVEVAGNPRPVSPVRMPNDLI